MLSEYISGKTTDEFKLYVSLRCSFMFMTLGSGTENTQLGLGKHRGSGLKYLFLLPHTNLELSPTFPEKHLVLLLLETVFDGLNWTYHSLLLLHH